MSHFVKGRGMNWSKAGKESILEQEAGKEVKTSGRETELQSQGHLTLLPAHQLGDALNIFVPLTDELSAWHMVGIL